MSLNTQFDDHTKPRFSPDGRKIIFERERPVFDQRTILHVYDLETGELGYYLPPPGRIWLSPSYSHAGDKVVFVTRPDHDRRRDFYSQRHDVLPRAQIAIMDIDGSNLRVVTDTQGLKYNPVFSHSDRKVIFAQAELIRDSGKTLAAEWDLWELDLETGQLGLFAGNFKFYQMGLSVYFPDDRRVLLAGYGPKAHSEIIGPEGYLAKSSTDYMKRYSRSQVFVVERGQARLKPPLFTDFDSARGATLDREENIYFYAQGLDFSEGMRVRRAAPDGSRQSWDLPPIRSTTTMSFIEHVVSLDGTHVAGALQDGVPHGNRKIVILEITSGLWRDLLLPDKAVQINHPEGKRK